MLVFERVQRALLAIGVPVVISGCSTDGLQELIPPRAAFA